MLLLFSNSMRVCVRASLLNVCQKIKRYLSLWANAIRMIFWCVLIHIIFVLIILIIVKNIRHKKVNFSESLKNESIHKLRYYQRRRSKSLSKLYNLQTNNTKNVHLMHSVQFFSSCCYVDYLNTKGISYVGTTEIA